MKVQQVVLPDPPCRRLHVMAVAVALCTWPGLKAGAELVPGSAPHVAAVDFNTDLLSANGGPVDVSRFRLGRFVAPATYSTDVFVNHDFLGRADIVFRRQDPGGEPVPA